MQADYTRKTQELADARRSFEAERDEARQFSQAELSAIANLNTIDGRIDQYARVDWNAWSHSDPAAAQQAFTQFQLLKDARRETVGYLGTLQQERSSKAEQEVARRIAEGMGRSVPSRVRMTFRPPPYSQL
jgi:hypothetical protein